MGRVTTYSQEFVDAICDRMADGESLRSICRDPKMPSRKAVRNWLLAHEEFRARYVKAAEYRSDTIFDEMLEIADTPRLGTKTVSKVGRPDEIIEGDMVEHRKLQISTRQWILGKMQPKKYGEKLDLTHGGPDGGPVKQLIYSGVLAEDDAKA